MLSQFARIREEARTQYGRFVHDGQHHPSIWSGLRHQIYLGSDDFVGRMQRRLQASERVDEISKVQRRPVPPSLQAFTEAYDDKRAAMAAAYETGGYTLKAIAVHFGVHSSTVSRAVRQAMGQPPA